MLPSAPPKVMFLCQVPASWKPRRTAARACLVQRPDRPLKRETMALRMYTQTQHVSAAHLADPSAGGAVVSMTLLSPLAVTSRIALMFLATGVSWESGRVFRSPRSSFGSSPGSSA